MSSFEERLAELEAKLPTLKELPLGPLSRWLEKNWDPDPVDLFGSSPLTQLGVQSGLDTSTWAAGANAAGIRTVTHQLGVTPRLVFVQGGQATGGPEIVVAQPFNIGVTTFQYQAKFLAGAVWAAGGTHNCAWLALV